MTDKEKIIPKNIEECYESYCIDCVFHGTGKCPEFGDTPEEKYHGGRETIKPEYIDDCLKINCSVCFYSSIKCPVFSYKPDKTMKKDEDIDNTIVEATEMINEAYEALLHKLFTLGDYMYDLKVEYKDVDGKTITMSWQDRDKRLEWSEK